jgi:hypothetical protein
MSYLTRVSLDQFTRLCFHNVLHSLCNGQAQSPRSPIITTCINPLQVVKITEERGKVSSIRIRKTRPKPQNNLTPMGLPKAIRYALLYRRGSRVSLLKHKMSVSDPPPRRGTLGNGTEQTHETAVSCYFDG